MHIELWPIDRPKPFPKNARHWNAAAVAKVAASIREYGFRQPIVVDVHDVICIGHLRLAAAKSLGLKEVPVHVARDLTAAQIRGLRLADNRTNQEAEWNDDLLGPELAELSDLGFDLTLTGFDVYEIDKLLRDPLDGERAEQAPPLPDVAATTFGDLGSWGIIASCVATLPAWKPSQRFSAIASHCFSSLIRRTEFRWTPSGAIELESTSTAQLKRAT